MNINIQIVFIILNRDINLYYDNYVYKNKLYKPIEQNYLVDQINLRSDYQNINLKNENKFSLTEPSSIENEDSKTINSNYHYNLNDNKNEMNLKKEYNIQNTNLNNYHSYIKKNNFRNNNIQINQYKMNPIQNSNYSNYRMNNLINNKNYKYNNNKNLSLTNFQINNNSINDNNYSNILYNNQLKEIKTNNYINNNQLNDLNFYKYINHNTNINDDNIKSLNTTKQNSYKNLKETNNEKNNRKNKSLSPNNPLIYTPNINNYQNNFYVQYTSPRVDSLYYNQKKIEEIENESTNSINLSVLADDIIQGFELDKKTDFMNSDNNNLIEESIIQYDNNDVFIPLNSTIKQMRKNIEDFHIEKFNDEDKINVSKSLNDPIINQNYKQINFNEKN